jgi:hypothetical protein
VFQEKPVQPEPWPGSMSTQCQSMSMTATENGMPSDGEPVHEAVYSPAE